MPESRSVTQYLGRRAPVQREGEEGKKHKWAIGGGRQGRREGGEENIQKEDDICGFGDLKDQIKSWN